ncbi:uncharacterized protein LOC106352475, partial [Brassica napus]|uniref:uncharacterized protein LOC106352475 n=1 Tax=Brassica napus TaxID=3708 RepID=UPI0020787621
RELKDSDTGNCGLKPKVLSETGAPAPEELKTSPEDQKIDAAKSLINLFLQDKVDKTTKDDEKTAPEKLPVTEDLKTALTEAKSPADDQKIRKEDAVRVQKVIDDLTVMETETDAKPEEVRREAAA